MTNRDHKSAARVLAEAQLEFIVPNDVVKSGIRGYSCLARGEYGEAMQLEGFVLEYGGEASPSAVSYSWTPNILVAKEDRQSWIKSNYIDLGNEVAGFSDEDSGSMKGRPGSTKAGPTRTETALLGLEGRAAMQPPTIGDMVVVEALIVDQLLEGK